MNSSLARRRDLKKLLVERCAEMATPTPSDAGGQIEGYNFTMQKPLHLDEAFSGIVTGYSKGFRDKQQTISRLKGLHNGLSSEEREHLYVKLVHMLKTSDVNGKNVGGILVNLAALALCCLAEFGPTHQLPELVFLRLTEDPTARDAWVCQIASEFQWSLTKCAERFESGALEQIKIFCAEANSRSTPYANLVMFALNGLARTIEYIEFERFEKLLAPTDFSPRSDELALEHQRWSFSINLKAALHKADGQLRTEGEFEPKIAADLIRTAIDQAHREITDQLVQHHQLPYIDPDRDGNRRQYMRKVNFISRSEEEFFSAIYSLISKEASHQLIAPRERRSCCYIEPYRIICSFWKNV